MMSIVPCRLLIALALAMAYYPWSVVKAQSATDILSRTEAALKQGAGVDATFALTSPEGDARGTIHLQGQRFFVETPGMRTWFDGQDQWTYLSGANEITITTPTAEELQTLNPYAWLNLYRNGGYELQAEALTAAAGSSSTAASKGANTSAAYRVTLVATARRALWSRIVITLTSAYRLASVQLTPSGAATGASEATTITVTSYRDGLNYPDTHFQPARADYPDTEFIDLR